MLDDRDVEIGEAAVDDRVARAAADDHEIVMAHGCHGSVGNTGDAFGVDVGAWLPRCKLKVKVIDRTALILDIFAQHARSRDGKAQVAARAAVLPAAAPARLGRGALPAGRWPRSRRCRHRRARAR